METTNLVMNLFKGVIPERVEEVDQLRKDYLQQAREVSDQRGFNLSAGAFSIIQYTRRSLCQIWLFGYAGKQALNCYSSPIALMYENKITFSLSELYSVEDQKQEYMLLKKHLDDIKAINKASFESDVCWPAYIPTPEDGRPSDVENAAAFDLIIMATAYIFLHELKHVIFTVDGNAPNDPKVEEYECDEYAKFLMTSNIQQYVKTTNEDENKVRMKRMMGISLASAFILFTTGKNGLAGTCDHPSVWSRWRKTIDAVNLPNNDHFWLYFSSLAIGLLEYHSIKITPTLITDYKSFLLHLINDLENSI